MFSWKKAWDLQGYFVKKNMRSLLVISIVILIVCMLRAAKVTRHTRDAWVVALPLTLVVVWRMMASSCSRLLSLCLPLALALQHLEPPAQHLGLLLWLPAPVYWWSQQLY